MDLLDSPIDQAPVQTGINIDVDAFETVAKDAENAATSTSTGPKQLRVVDYRAESGIPQDSKPLNITSINVGGTVTETPTAQPQVVPSFRKPIDVHNHENHTDEEIAEMAQTMENRKPQMIQMCMQMAQCRNFMPTIHCLNAFPQWNNDLMDDQGNTPLHWAVMAGAVPAVRMLIDKFNLNVNAKNGLQQSPIMWACTEGNLLLMQYLHSKGAELNFRDAVGANMIIISAQSSRMDVFLWLLAQGVDLTATDQTGHSVAHWAAYKNSVDMLRLLKYFRVAFSNLRDKTGGTPLHIAALAGHFEACVFLTREGGVDASIEDQEGKTAADFAAQFGHEQLAAQLLREEDLQKASKKRREVLAAPVMDLLMAGEISAAASRLFAILTGRGEAASVAAAPAAGGVRATPLGRSRLNDGFDDDDEFGLADEEAGGLLGDGGVKEENTGFFESAAFEPETSEEFAAREAARNLPLFKRVFAAFFDLEGRNFGWATNGISRFFPTLFFYWAYFSACGLIIFDIRRREVTTHLPGFLVGDQAVGWIVILVLAAVQMVNYLVLMLSNPGIKKKRPAGNSAIEDVLEDLKKPLPAVQTEADIAALTEKQDISRLCMTCYVKRGLRTKHCRACGVCVGNMDHHCVWINNCVGQGNHKHFIFFLVMHLVSALAGLFALLPALRATWMEKLTDAAHPTWGGWFGGLGSFLVAGGYNLVVCFFILLTFFWVGMILHQQLRTIDQNFLGNEMINAQRYKHFWRPVRVRPENPTEGEGEEAYELAERYHNPFDLRNPHRGLGYAPAATGNISIDDDESQWDSYANCKAFWFGSGLNEDPVRRLSPEEILNPPIIARPPKSGCNTGCCAPPKPSANEGLEKQEEGVHYHGGKPCTGHHGGHDNHAHASHDHAHDHAHDHSSHAHGGNKVAPEGCCGDDPHCHKAAQPVHQFEDASTVDVLEHVAPIAPPPAPAAQQKVGGDLLSEDDVFGL